VPSEYGTRIEEAKRRLPSDRQLIPTLAKLSRGLEAELLALDKTVATEVRLPLLPCWFCSWLSYLILCVTVDAGREV
jgi:hypothetical protein